ncbi:hypothetical protein PR202_gb19006 [Eleusine coracana subsp. coracana]|uniref:Polymerase nucleotidyl transferase domain-containing protein n=1 Tax=Eleusine coracana subsp. coracana TaxID=191504 RepID=A0AAV5F730_ELECO|nr:hypothetical protein PR202_gb19006 [Eleusine coracana subsp. coracana]
MGMVLNGLLPDASVGMTRRLDPERWEVAEGRTAELISCIQPNEHSEGRRLAVYHYVQRIIASCLSCPVFTFGSVPLKTYLPDGDIDVTAVGHSEELKEIWANLVRDALEREEKNENAEFHVKEVQYIQAEVKIIKCLVENIVVDISYNQVGGLCTLCFLEQVLFRFLEFFSNFDWEKFCLSLSGPVPISSLPDITAEPPRMDSGKLLLSKAFLDFCSSMYGVVPHTQESQGQPFVSKHFNVIDPLRTGNNLGRSVSKGNFFRIRNAFAFGAKSLGKLLECSKENLTAQLNQFFANTWIRHGNGSRPDVPIPNLLDVRSLKGIPAVVSNSHKTARTIKRKTENPKLRANEDNFSEAGHSYRPSSQAPHKSDVHKNPPRIVYPSDSHAQHKRNYVTQGNTKLYEHLERNNSAGSMQGERDRSAPNNLYANERNGKNRTRFARSQSSPELTDSSVEGLRGRRIRVIDMEKPPMVDYSSRNVLVPEMSGNHSTKSSQDESVSSMNSSPHPSTKAPSDSNIVSSSYREDNAFVMNEEFSSVSESSEMHHDEQVLVDLMASAKLHGLNGQVQLPMQIPSHLSVAHSPLLSPTVFSQNHLAGIPPASLIGTPWLPNMQFFHGFIQPPMAHYIHNPTFAPKSEDGNESDRPVTSDENHDTGNNWHEYTVGFSGHFSSEGRDPHIYDVDGNEHSSLPNGVPVAPLERQMEFTIEDNGVGDENYTHVIQSQTGGEASGYVNAPYSYASSSGDKAMNVSSWDEMSVNTSRSLSDKWGKRPSFAAPAPTTHSKVGWQMGSSLEHLPTEVDDGPRNGTSGSTINEASEIVAGPNPLSVQSRAGQVPNEFDQSQMGVPNPMSASFLIGSQQRQADSSGLTLVPTASPVPFVVLPFFPGTSDGSVPQFEQSEGTDQHPANSVGKKFSSLNEVHQPDTSITSTAFCGIMAEPPSDEHKPDILNSDLIGHWRNLQYGRFCQNAPPVGPVFYPFMVPQMYLQSHAPWDGPGRPVAPNVNWTQMVGPGQRVFPVMPVQPTTERLTGGLQHYGEDAPRYRAGTGTYFPNPKAPFRDRHSSSRNYRGGYSNDRSDHSDKEGSWANSKHRNPNRSYGRSQSERSGMRPDRHATDDNQSDRQRRTYRNDSYRHDSGAQYLMQGQYFGSTNSMRKPANVTHEVYTPPSAASNGGALSGPPGPPFLMMCSYKPGVNHGASSSEPIEFGSLGPLPTANGDDMPRPTRQVMPNGFYGQKRGPYRGGSSHSSPDQPSSPQPRR